jgi:hypothetical protein
VPATPWSRRRTRTHRSAHSGALIVAVTALAGIGLAAHAPAAQAATGTVGTTSTTGTTYYVSTSGSDANSGTDASSPWQSLAKVDATTFQPGDRILFEDGDSWTGQLWPKGSGTADAPITLGSYGSSGAKPSFAGAGAVADTVKLWNQQYWTVTDIDVSNNAPSTGTPGANLGDFRGIHLGGDDGQTLSGLVVDAVDVHDVTGEVNWIGGSTSGNKPGINFATGWDLSKDTGGIVFNTSVPDIAAPPSTPTILSGITIENSTVENTSFAGIVVKQYTGDAPGAVATGWGSRTSGTDPKYAPFTNVTIQGNYVTQNGTPYGADGIYITDTRGGLVQNNLVDRAGTSGIEIYFTDQVTAQHNEVSGTTVKAGGGDSNGLDTDIGNSAVVAQYNYLHNNNVGYLACACKSVGFGSATFRYNVVANNSQIAVQLDNSTGMTSVYNNTFYNSASQMVSGSGPTSFSNNVFYTTVASPGMVTASNIAYQHNYYGGQSPTIPSSESQPITGDARFTDPTVTGPFGTAATGPELATADAYKQTSGSALIDSAVPISGNGGVDYAGDSLYNNAPDIGAFEYSTPAGSTVEAIDGTITSSIGANLSGATVTVTFQGQKYTATTDANGYYAVLNIPFTSSATVAVSKADYKTATATVAVAAGDSTRLNLALTPSTTTGIIQGQVDDAQARPLSGATVTLSSAGQTIASTVTDSVGAYSFATVPAGTGYTLTAAESGYRDASVSGVSVSPATTTTPGTLMVPTTAGTTLQTHEFNALPPGPLATGTDAWTTTAAGGSVGIVTDTPGTNRSLQISRSTNSGSTDAELDFSTPLKGLVTVEADVQRTDKPGANSADYFSAPYVYGSSSTPAVAVATSQGAIEAYEGSTIQNLTSYTAGTWYHLALVIDTVNQTYDLYINGTELVSHAPFRTSLPGIQRISYYANSSNYGTELVDNVRVGYGLNPLQSAAPAKAALSTTQGWNNGLVDGYYNVQLNNWWGTNATSYSLYQNGELVYTEPLLSDGDNSQAATVTIAGLPNGTYVYTGVLSNSAGTTATSSVTVKVTGADPGTPVLSDDGYNGSEDTTVTTDMWWGTNASEYELYVDGALVDHQQLTAATPGAQHATTDLTGLSPGQHQVVAVLSNQFGSTSSKPLTLTVK